MKQTFTSASANKQIHMLQDEKEHLLSKETRTSTYTMVEGEDIEPDAYSYEETSQKLDEIDNKIRALRHAIHASNMNTLLPDFGITIDEALVLMAQLTQKSHRLDTLRNRSQVLRKSPSMFGDSKLVEYIYAHYDVAQVERDYEKLLSQITQLQLALDLSNQTATFVVEW